MDDHRSRIALKAPWGILGALFLYALAPSLAIQLKSRGLSAIEIFFLYSLGGSVALFIILAIQPRDPARNFTRRRLITATLFGVFGYSLYYALYLTALTKAPASGIPAVMMVNYTWPIFSLMFVRRFVDRRRISAFEKTGLLIATVGVYFASSKGSNLSFSLDLLPYLALALMGGIVWGAFTAGTRKYAINDIGAVLVFNLSALLISGLSVFSHGQGTVFSDGKTVALGVLTGAICYAGGTALYVYGIRQNPSAGQLALFNFTPFAALGIMALIHGIPLGGSALFGATIVILGILTATYGSRWSEWTSRGRIKIA